MTHVNWGKVGLVAGGVVAAGAAVAGIVAIATHKRDPDDFVHKRLDGFNSQGGDGISESEAVRNRATNRTVTISSYRIGDYVVSTKQRQHTTWTESVLRAVNAADADSDAVASWKELTALATTFDRNKDARLSWGEQGKFDDSYGMKTSNRHTTVTDQWTDTTYSPKPKPQPHSGGGTSPGDNYGGGGTSPGDDYGGGGGYGGNSTDNGNPSDSDF